MSEFNLPPLSRQTVYVILVVAYNYDRIKNEWAW